MVQVTTRWLMSSASRCCSRRRTAQTGRFECSHEAQRHFEALVNQSAGNFLYAVTALNDIEAGNTRLQDVQTLPTELHELYAHFFQRLFGPSSERYRMVRPVFEVVASSYNGATKAMILQCLRVSDPSAGDEDLLDRFETVKQFLREEPSKYEGGPPTCMFFT